MTDADYLTLEDIIEDNLSEWIHVSDQTSKRAESTNMIVDNVSGYDASAVCEAVTREYNNFLSDKRAYVIKLLEKGRAHTLYSIPAYVQNNKIKNRAKMKEIRSVVIPTLRRIRRMNKRLNLKNQRGIFKGPMRKFGAFIRHPSKTSFKNFLKSGYLSYNALFDSDLYERIKGDYDLFKNAPSARTHIDHYIDWAKKDNPNTPHFACIHVDDVHNPEVFFTYDSDDVELIRREIADAESLLDTIPKNLSGSITHLLSLRYIDGVIRYMYDRLEGEGMLDNTVIAICADHGFSFGGVPLRDSFVVNLYLENYNIPFVITGAGHEGLRITDLRTSKDIPATLCDIADGIIPQHFNGRSVINTDGYAYVTVEYCGGGCPDMLRRELKIAAFNNDWFVGTLATLQQSVDDETLTEIYDIKNDPLQLKNLVGKDYDRDAVEHLIDVIRKRKDELLLETKQRVGIQKPNNIR